MNQYFIIHKPYHVLSQFSSSEERKTLKDFFDVPANVYPVGRLDFDSEGLLILTNDKKVNHLILNPQRAHEREYWVQVEGNISEQSIFQLQQGVKINISGKIIQTKKCRVEKFVTPPKVDERNPPIRVRKLIPDSWIKIILTEGKNRQVRKITAKVGHPTLRLIRYRIESINIDNLYAGQIKAISQQELYNLLKIQK